MKLPRFAKELAEPGAQIGRALSRLDGPAKLTGAARYAAELDPPNLLHGYVVSSAIAKGKITRLDTAAALALHGVVQVFSHENRPHLAWFDRKWKDDDAPKGEPFRPLYDANIVHAMQPIALVVAETFEAARAAARLLVVEYAESEHETDLEANRARTYTPGKEKSGFQPPPKPRGDAARALAAAAVTVDAEYTQATEHHNPMELFASTVHYHDDGKLTVYDKTQGVQNSQHYLVNVFGLAKGDVQVFSPYVGGAFGSGLRPQHQLFLAVLAATELKRSVRVELSRPQMFSFGHRPETIQRVALGADRDGTLTSVIHHAVQESSQFENYVEVVVNWAGQQYRCDNVSLEYELCRLDIFTPLDMRAPGAQVGVAALECAVDELAYALDMDPLALRLKNYTDTDPNTDKPFSSKELRACFEQGAERFGWAKRAKQPRATREGHELVGVGMAAGVWDAMQNPADARATLRADGMLIVESAASDIGTGTYTVMAQIAADILGLPMERVRFDLGDSSMPMAPIEGGSWTVSSVGSAVKLACDQLKTELVKLATKHGLATDPLAIPAILAAAGKSQLVEEVKSLPYLLQRMKHTFATHSAVFAEVRVDEDLGVVTVTRIVSAIAAGRIINPKTATSQIIGGIVWGIGQALEEETLTDHTLGRYMNHDLSEYHVPVNADVRAIEVIFVPEADPIVNALGAKGVGEIGIVGVAAAIANAIFHATGKRVRDFPITVDKLV